MKNSFALNPIQSYKIDGELLSQKRGKWIQDFFTICGPSISQLELRFNDSSDISPERFGVASLRLPSLKTLKFCVESTTLPRQTIDQILAFILRAAVNLESFQLILDGPAFQIQKTRSRQSVSDRFGEILATSLPHCLKDLKISFNYGGDQRSILPLQVDFKLTSLSLLFSGSISPEDILRFLESQSRTLRSLQLLKINTIYDKVLILPSAMMELETLKLNCAGAVPEASEAVLFPKLKTLDANNWKMEKSFVNFLEAVKGSAMLEELNFPSQFMNFRLVKIVGKTFPKLKRVEVNLLPYFIERCKTAVEALFAYFPETEKLTLHCPTLAYNLDSLLSGVGVDDVEQIMGENDLGKVDIRDLQSGHSSILNLKKLRSLEIHARGGSPISNFSAHFLFLQMEFLRELFCFADCANSFSNEYKAKLGEKLNFRAVPDNDIVDFL